MNCCQLPNPILVDGRWDPNALEDYQGYFARIQVKADAQQRWDKGGTCQDIGNTLERIKRYCDQHVWDKALEECIRITGTTGVEKKLLAEAFRFRGSILYNEYGKKDEALEYLRKSLVEDPSNIKARIGYGIVLYSLGRYTEVVKECTWVLDLFPNNVSALRYKGDALVCLGQYAEAVKYYKSLLSSSPNDVHKIQKNYEFCLSKLVTKNYR